MSSSTQPTSAQPGDAASSTPETAPESLTTSAPVAASPASPASPETPETPETGSTDASASVSVSVSSTDAKPADKAAQEGGRVDVPAVAAALKELFPALFSGQAKPVKLRIQADIQERAPGKFSKQQLSAFLRRYTGGTGYLIGLTKAKHRFDLDGQPAGEISDEHRQAAQEELTRRRGITETRRADEERGRLDRAQLLRDFSRTTLTPANFCALKGLTQEQLDAQLALAREEATQQPPRGDRRGDRPAGGERRADGGQRPPRGDGQGRPRGDGQPRPDGGKRPPRRNNG